MFEEREQFSEREERLDPEEQSDWEKKEQEKREEIRTKFTVIIEELHGSVSDIIDIVESGEIKTIAFAKRVILSEEDIKGITKNIGNINFLLGKSRPMLDSYIKFTNTTPDFKSINDIIFQLSRFMTDTQRKPFYQIHEEKYGKRYFKKVPILKLANDVSILSERILGTLEVAGDYIVDVGKLSSNNTRRQDYDVGGYGSDRYSYWDRKNWDKTHKDEPKNFETEQRRKQPDQRPLRDVGDVYEPAEKP